jgi:hypothetical protein
MRLNEFSGKLADDIIEDEADTRGDANLITALEFLRNRSHDRHLVPKVRVDSLIGMVKNTGRGEFNLDSLLGAFKTNETVKNLIKDIKDDEHGVKYIYLKQFTDDKADDSPTLASGGSAANPEKTVDAMAQRALKNRS